MAEKKTELRVYEAEKGVFVYNPDTQEKTFVNNDGGGSAHNVTQKK